MEKKKYYIDIGSGEISQTKYQNNDSFTIHATDEEVAMLRAKLNNMDSASMQAFWRAHVPIMPYHNDKPNDHYDTGLVEVYQMLYDLGDDTIKSHIDSIGILEDNHM
ncbi:hydrolase [Ornithinibacillus bavariensis]|uniref:Hydrolase n=1 Tax=Ornithinibacillus bavariensis TaxID=545502 RepID=A0A920C788_9BACI|nr:hydrolase [Ornithinibacillus bavariensis]GIO28600.1 hypothetical protein J43TS3_32110 [Ornithinibacillus bavariensis]HAM79328.1 hydrolase [Ornithinibacillus sp.]